FEQTRIVFRSLLNHPGAVVVNTLRASSKIKRYAAISSYAGAEDTHGCRFAIRGPEGPVLDSVLIDWGIKGYRENVITFKNTKDLPLGSLLCPNPYETPHEQNQIAGWGLSNQIVCSALLQLFEAPPIKDMLGMLCLDSWSDDFDNDAGVTITAQPEDIETGFVCGRGPRLTKTHPRHISIPCRHHHNGASHGEWRLELCNKTDVVELSHRLISLALDSQPQQKTHKPLHSPQIEIHDHVSSVLAVGEPPPSYTEAITTTLKKWNEIHAQQELHPLAVSAHHWPALRNSLISCGCIVRDIKQDVPSVLDAIITYCPLFKGSKTMRVHFFAHAQAEDLFRPHHTLFSVESFSKLNWSSFMAFKLASNLCESRLETFASRPILKHLVSNGFGLWLACQLFNCQSADVLGVELSVYETLERNILEWRSRLSDFVTGAFWEIKQGRHEELRLKEISNPFSGEGGVPHYGNFLGYLFVRDYLKTNGLSSLMSEEGLLAAETYFS
ncbi:MAG TPA: hypothetical protein VJC18_07085, partial [bacterium]|nr:hypothetical protein [bacterium]